jgi:hypothetical protein
MSFSNFKFFAARTAISSADFVWGLAEVRGRRLPLEEEG